MNNAKNKLTDGTAAQRGWKRIEVDAMPDSVATDLLCSLRRVGGPERRMLNSARVQRFCSTQEKQSLPLRLSNRFAVATLAQLGHWSKRAQKKRRKTQQQYEAAVALKDKTPLVQRMLAALDVAAAIQDAIQDGASSEVNWRMGLARGDALPKFKGVEVCGAIDAGLRAWNGTRLDWTPGRPRQNMKPQPAWRPVLYEAAA